MRSRNGDCTSPAIPTRCIRGCASTRRAGSRRWSIAPGDTGAFPPLAAAALVDALHQAPATYGLTRSRWVLAEVGRAVPDVASYTLGGLSRLVRRLGIRRQRGQLRVHSPDLAYQEKVAWLERGRATARAAPDRVRFLYGDEFSVHRQPTLAPTYAPVGTVPLARQVSGSDHTQRVAGALDAWDGRVTWLGRMSMGVDGLRRFLRRLRRAYPDGETLLLVWDNWPVHQHAAVLAEAAKWGIQLLWLPTYAPWLNPIEKLWRKLKQELLHHHRLAHDWSALKAAVAHFLDRFAHASPDLLHYVGLLPN